MSLSRIRSTNKWWRKLFVSCKNLIYIPSCIFFFSIVTLICVVQSVRELFCLFLFALWLCKTRTITGKEITTNPSPPPKPPLRAVRTWNQNQVNRKTQFLHYKCLLSMSEKKKMKLISTCYWQGAHNSDDLTHVHGLGKSWHFQTTFWQSQL